VGPIDSPFSREHTADEVSESIDLSGKRAIVTGGASGIGIETARSLARRGAAVTIAARRLDSADSVVRDIIAATGNTQVHAAALELNDPASVAGFAAAWSGPLHILVNNAGVMAIPELVRTQAGHEMQFATNHLGHFALSCALHGALAEARGARIVALSSTAHLFSPVVFDDINFHFRPYDPQSAYAQSKTAEILFAVGATAKWSGDGILANAVNPGAISTPLQRHVGGKLATPLDLQKTPQQGASTSLFAATSPLLDGIGGRYFDDNNEAQVTDHRPPAIEDLVGRVARYALDPGNADRLWLLSEQLLR
jgi:NAD(P)-dependent dehydrogenase (short-subunit alcohol dehydrogenase family)